MSQSRSRWKMKSLCFFPFFLVSSLLYLDRVSSFSSHHKSTDAQRRYYSPTILGAHDDAVVVALTREKGKNGKLLKELQERLGNTKQVQLEELACIAHADGEDFANLAPTLLEGDFDYVAVTSPEAAKVLGTVWNSVLEEGVARKPSIAVVGKATQSALESLGIPADFCPSKALARFLVQELPEKEGTGTTTLLYPASAKAASTLQEGLEARGFAVTRLNTYDTVTATWTDSDRQVASKVKVACFGSPSAVEGWLQNTNNNKNVMAACIGETSATACRQHQWNEGSIYYPEKPGIPGWASAVEEALESIQVAHTASN